MNDIKQTVQWMIIITALVSKIKPISSKGIYAYVDGDLSDSWKFNFSIIAHDLKGILLFCMDSFENQFRVTIAQDDHNRKQICIVYKEIFGKVSLQQLCGCDPCNDTFMNFYVSLNEGVISASCGMAASNQNDFSYPIDGSGVLNQSHKDFCFTKNDNDFIYPLPRELINTRKQLSIWMSNVGPYSGKENVRIRPRKEQLYGCLNTFFINDTKIRFKGIERGFSKSCLESCLDSLCHGGTCQAITTHGPSCNCSTTALNGPDCRKDLQKYEKGSHNAYEILMYYGDVHIKLSWKAYLKTSCLIEFFNGKDYLLTWIHRGELMMNSNFMSTVAAEGNNFLSIIVTNSSLTIKIKHQEYTWPFKVSEKTLMNMGVSARGQQCAAFRGTYDLHYEEFQIGKVNNSTSILRHCESKRPTLVLPAIVSVLLMTIVILTIALAQMGVYLNSLRSKSKENVYEMEDVSGKPTAEIPSKKNYNQSNEISVYETV